MGIIQDLFSLAKDSRSVLRDVKTERRKIRGMANLLLGEVEFNMDLILDHYLEKKVDVRKIISMLKTAQLEKALADGFDFSKLRSGKIADRHTGENLFLKKYVGKDCAFMMKKIHHHLLQVKLLPELYDLNSESKINVQARLDNLGRRYLLLIRFITDKK
jgi:hypothetical protein